MSRNFTQASRNMSFSIGDPPSMKSLNQEQRKREQYKVALENQVKTLNKCLKSDNRVSLRESFTVRVFSKFRNGSVSSKKHAKSRKWWAAKLTQRGSGKSLSVESREGAPISACHNKSLNNQIHNIRLWTKTVHRWWLGYLASADWPFSRLRLSKREQLLNSPKS